jgi:DNA-binding NarL/FixJ family response regulator
VTALATSAAAALASIETSRPDLAIVGTEVAGRIDGIELARQVRDRWRLPVVFLIAPADRETIERLKETGPFGCIAKPFSEGQLCLSVELALSQAAQDQRRDLEVQGVKARAAQVEARSASLEGRLRQIAALLGDLRGAANEFEPIAPGLEAALASLTPRELELMRLLLEHRRTATIARELSVSVHTVRNHLRSMFRKLGVHSQEELLSAVRALPPDLLEIHRRP